MKNESAAASGVANFFVVIVIAMASLAAPLAARSQTSPPATAQSYPGFVALPADERVLGRSGCPLLTNLPGRAWLPA